MGRVEVNDGRWKALLKRVTALKTVVTHVGVIGNAEQAAIAAYMEFGTRTIPARSFILSTLYIRRRNALSKICATLGAKVLAGKLDEKQAVGMIGAWAAAQIKNTITEIDIPPPLADATVQAKGSSKPLVDTGQLLDSITWEVVEK